MPLMKRFLIRISMSLAASILWPVMAASLELCTVTLDDFDFGTVSVRGGSTPQVMGTLRIDCSALVLASLIRFCIHVGPGDGEAGASNTPRYMTRADGTRLAYQLYRGGYGGQVLNEINGISFNLLNTKIYEEPIYAQIIDTGTAVKGGSYDSFFQGGENSIHFSATAGVLLSCTSLGPQIAGNFTVSADIVPSCTVSAGTLDFGTLGTNVTAPVAGQTTIDVTCSDNTPYTVYLGSGTGAGVSSPAARKMSSGANTLSYGLYRNSSMTQPWGWTHGVDGLSATGIGAVQSIPVYGQINPGQTAPVGIYNDSVVITVEY